jgi:hypothetical protein
MLEFTGFDVTEVDQMLKNIDGLVIDDPQKEWGGMPEYNSENMMAVKSIKVNFATVEDAQAFAKLVGQKITENTKFIWYPKAEILHSSLVVENDES